MRVATCTPVDFPADSQFFGRDSGLLCRGFQAAGHDSVVVMPGTRNADDCPDLVRCNSEEITSSSWWRSLGVELVVLYAWGDPRHREVAKAILTAGVILVQSLDTAGLDTPYGNTRNWWRCLCGLLPAPSPAITKARLIGKALRDLVPFLYERRRLAMIDCCDRLAVVSPPAADSIASYASALGYPQIADKIIVVPHPILDWMKPPATAKLPKVLVVGRWLDEDKAQKDPDLTMAVLGDFLRRQPGWTAEVVGRGSSRLDTLAQQWDGDSQSRLILTESVPREELVRRYQESRILLCCSRFESFHISSAEALCCGCSVVVADHALLSSTGWFTTHNSGTMAENRNRRSMLKALVSESFEWNSGNRDPMRISAHWMPLLHSKMVAARLVLALPYMGHDA